MSNEVGMINMGNILFNGGSNMWIKNNFFKYGLSILLVTVIIFMFGQISFFLAPFQQFVAVLFFPILLSAAFYYLFRPMVNLLGKIKIPKTPAILIVFLVVLLIISMIATYAGSIIVSQFSSLFNDLPQIAQTARAKAESFRNNNSFVGQYKETVETQLISYLQSLVPSVTDGIKSTIYAITNIASVFVVVPFILFYLLKDDRIFYDKLKRYIPEDYGGEVTEIIKETDKTLSTYIIGQAIIALILGILTFLGYTAIGLKYAFILAIFVCFTSFIPMFGVVLGVVPALLVGLSMNPFMMVKILIVCLFVQQIEGNFVSPYVIGKRLDMHPLTIVIIFLVAASLYGFIGMLIVVPTYAVMRVLILGAWRVYKVSRIQNTLE